MSHLAPMQCKYCNTPCIKKGSNNTIQKFYCKLCKKYQRNTYRYQLLTLAQDLQIAALNNEAMSISSISRILVIPKTTVRRRLFHYSKTISAPAITETKQVYEVDEMQTYIGKRTTSCYTYITYAINRTTKQVIDFVVGKRSQEVIAKLITKVLSLAPRKIYTDGLNIYPGLIPKHIHRCFQYRTNIIERNNLTIRNSLKRLTRKTICFSKSALMLEACLKLHFWGRSSFVPIFQ